ncbi:MAG: hypothetical protein QNJ68_16625 [Microcoleaceae cyanobacterium MO_207.B10]|nr:hypothetical protein [Microcoleaceae cyanobacterium MO_207.B10]
MLTKLKLIPRKHHKSDYIKNHGIVTTAVAMFQSQNALYQWEKNPVLLAVGWLKIN